MLSCEKNTLSLNEYKSEVLYFENFTDEIRTGTEKSEPVSDREKVRIIFAWCAWQDLNLHPREPEPNGNVTLVEVWSTAHRTNNTILLFYITL